MNNCEYKLRKMMPMIVLLFHLAWGSTPWPLPALMSQSSTSLCVHPNISIDLVGADSDVAQFGILRYQNLLRSLARSSPYQPGTGCLRSCSANVTGNDASLGRHTDESYALNVSASNSCVATARSVFGLLHALESLLQLAGLDGVLRNVPVHIIDRPRFLHRAVMLDTGYRFVAVKEIEQILDTMAANKLNVLHWHITDFASFPSGSTRFPELAAKGAHGRNPSEREAATYQPVVMKAVVEHARLRGVRVIPEWDIPGHGSWGKGRPDLMVATCGDTLDPSNPETYSFLADFFEDMLTVFPDEDWFLGGDETAYTSCYGPGSGISKWAKQHNFTGYDAFNYFWRNLSSALDRRVTKRLGVWFGEPTWNCSLKDCTPRAKDLPAGSWAIAYENEPGDVATAASRFAGGAVFAGPWYLDTQSPTSDCSIYARHELWKCVYAADPLAHALNVTQCASGQDLHCVLGGEATQWGATAGSFGTSTWLPAAAIAEVLWSGASTGPAAAQVESRLADQACRMAMRGEVGVTYPLYPGFCPSDIGIQLNDGTTSHRQRAHV